MTTTRRILAGTVDVSIVIRIIDSVDGTPETGVVFNTSGIDLEYRRELAASVDITEATLAALTTAHADGGFLHIGNGYYRLDLPDAACAAGVTGVLVHGVVTGMVVIGTYIELVAYNPYDAVRLGLTALPNAAAEAAGGLYTRGTGAGQINQAANGMMDTNSVRLNNVSQSLLDLKDFADDGYDPATNKVQGVVLTDTLTTYTGNTPQTGDSFARLGLPAGASVSADIAAIEAQTDDIGAAGAGLTAIVWNSDWDAEVQSEVTDALNAYDPPTNAELVSEINSVQADIAALNNLSAAQVNTEVDTALADVNLDHLVGTAASIPAIVAGTYIDQMMDDGTAVYDRTTDSLQALRDNLATAAALDAVDNFIDAEIAAIISTLGTPAGASVSADIAAIEAQTDDIGVAGAGLTALGDTRIANLDATISSRASQASLDTVDNLIDTEITDIQARLPAALVSGRMDASVGAMAAGVVTAAAVATDAIDSDALAPNAITEIQNGLATSAALALVSAFIDTEIATLQLDVSAILADTGTDGVVVVAASKTGYALSAAGVDEIFDELRAGHSVVGSYGESFFTLESGAAIAGTLSTTQMSTNLTEATDDHYKGRIIIWVSGVLLRQATDITAYNGTTKVLTFTALTEAPSAADKFIIV